MSTAITILADSVSYAAWLFLIGMGLTLVFGVLKLLNIAHGGLYAFGAYSAAYAIGVCASHGLGVGYQMAAGLALATAVGALIGLIIERGVLRPLYRHQEALVLFATYAVFLILEDMTKLLWGSRSLYANQPRDALGQISLAGLNYPLYDVIQIGVAAVIALLAWFILAHTRVGRSVTAVVVDREMSAAMGVNVDRIMTGTFVVGAVLGALAGAVTAPKIAVMPGIGVEVIVLAFAVVVIGGLGSIGGVVIGAVIVGLCRSITAHLFPDLSIFAVYAAMATVLAVRPYGLFARPQVRKI